MRDPRLAELRREVLSDVTGEILEIGFGTGLNLPHYPESVRAITAVDPNAGMGRRARQRVAESRLAVDRREISGEALPFQDETFACVVSTWTLCSIPEAARALGEVYRVLQPAGRFVFLEHGLSDDPRVQKWQRRLNPFQKALADGCRLDLDIDALITGQPFESVNLERFLMDRMPRTHGTMYRGVAVK
jgi:ubiquinone/menaquinone biosynthesis C-methylase UbiE